MPVKTGADIDRILLTKKPGDVLMLTRVRAGKSVEQSVKLMSRKKLYEVSNTREESTANISRQYVAGQAVLSGHAAVLQLTESRLQMLEAEIRELRRQIEQLKNQDR